MGLAYALTSYKARLMVDYAVNATDWSRFAGEVWNLQWDITLTVAVFYALAVVFAPESSRGDRELLQRLARRKLAQPLLTQDELELWSRIAEEARHDA